MKSKPGLRAEQKWKLALIDLDGTLFRDKEVIKGADKFIMRLREKGIQPVFFTNNSTRTPTQVVEKLKGFCIDSTEHEVCTSAQATAAYIRDVHGVQTKVCYIGTSGLHQELERAMLEPVSVKSNHFDEVSTGIAAAVVGLDTDIHYEHFARFCKVAYALQSFILTNPDVRLPVPDGFLPGNGALGAFVERATGIHPVVIGKPQPMFVDFALKKYRAAKEETFIVGDNLFTDIAAGNRAGIYAIQVRSGVVQKPALRKNPESDTANIKQEHLLPQPDEVCESVADLFI